MADITLYAGMAGTFVGSVISAIVLGLKSKKANDAVAKMQTDSADVNKTIASIVEDRVATKLARDTETQIMRERIAVCENNIRHQSDRMDEGNDRFARMEAKMDIITEKISEQNKAFGEIIGTLKNMHGGNA